MKSNFGFCVLLLISVLLCSCGTFRINNTSDFQKTENLSVLNGEYSARSEITKKAKSQVNINNLFDAHKDHTDFFNLTFEEPDKVTLSYWLMTEIGATKKTVSFKGKRKKKFLEIYFSKKQIFIPLVYAMFNIDRIRIGQDKNGNLLIRNFYDSSGYLLLFAAGHSEEIPYIFTKSDKYKGLKPFHENDKWGFLDINKNVLIPPKYDFSFAFKNNSSRVKLNEKWGLINESGEELTAVQYDFIDVFKHNFAKVKLNEKYGLINESGKEITPIKYDSISDTNTYRTPSVYFVEINKKIGILDSLGNEIISVIYDEINYKYDGFFQLKLGDKYGIASKEKLIFPPIYDKLGSFSYQGYMEARRNDSIFILDNEGYEYDTFDLKFKDLLFPKTDPIGVPVDNKKIVSPVFETKRKVITE